MSGTPPVARTFGAQEVETAAFLNSVSTAANFLLSPPRCKVTASALTSLVNNAYTSTAFGTETEDTDNMHDPVTNNSRITCKTPGLYHVTYEVTYAANATGNRFAKLFLNGATQIDSIQGGPATAISFIISYATDVRLALNDYLEVQQYQNSGAALNNIISGGYMSSMTARWVAT